MDIYEGHPVKHDAMDGKRVRWVESESMGTVMGHTINEDDVRVWLIKWDHMPYDLWENENQIELAE